MRDFLRDWQRWSVGERVAAIAIAAASTIGCSVAVAIGVL
jgi:hypothetical protein